MAEEMKPAQAWTDDDYVEKRLMDQINWYERKSGMNKRSFQRLRVVEIMVAASIPFLVPYATTTEMQIVVGGMGVIVAVIGSLLILYKYQENWVEYRKTAELLKSHHIRYVTGAAPYDAPAGPARYRLLVANAEDVMSAEWSNWSEVTLKRDDKQAEEEGAV